MATTGRTTRGQVTERTRILDEDTRNTRRQRQLDALEQDNFHDDPHANLVMHKNAPKFEDEEIFGISNKRKTVTKDGTKEPAKKRRKGKLEINKQRFRKNFALLHKEFNEKLKKAGIEEAHKGYMAYENATAPPPVAKPRPFCAVCGVTSGYTCVKCGTKFCSIRCRDVHNDTRCLKWTC